MFGGAAEIPRKSFETRGGRKTETLYLDIFDAIQIIFRIFCTGGSAAWLAHLVWDQRVVGSNPTRPTFWQTLFGQSAATSKTCYSRVPKYATTSRFSCVRALPQKSLRQNKSRALKVPTIICVGCRKKMFRNVLHFRRKKNG